MASRDNIIYTLVAHQMIRVGEPKAPDGIDFTADQRGNFLIISVYGDWSGFRNLAGCLNQINETPDMLAKEDRFYQIVERL